VLRAAFEYALSALPRHLPGHGYHPLGLTELREAVARRFTARGLPTTVDQILVTSGAQHALSVLLALTVGSRDRVLVEHPTYPNALDAIRRVDARPVPVAIGPDGWDVDMVAATVRQTSPRLAYLIPDFHNPTGLVATADERAALAGVLSRSRTLTVVDETLVELGFVDPPAPFAVYEPGVVTIGTASKTFWGGLRIGWIRAERSMIAKLAAVRASIDNASPVVEQLAVAYLIEHAGQILPARRRELIERRDALLGLLAERLPEWTTRPPDGGLVLWSDLGAPVSSRLVTAAANLGVRLAAGPRFGVDGAFERRLRLPYTHPPDVLDRAVDVIAQAYRATVARPDRSLVLDTFA
jgi:DNA-binding transcriptional MocR family regulator